mgnify:FL=1
MLGIWDICLLAAVPLQATAIAYLRKPRHKALLLSIPIPFTIATLAIGKPVDASNVLGLALLLGFAHGVRFLHVIVRAPIIPSIAGGALFYCLTGALLLPLIPTTETAFWAAAGIVIVVGTCLFILTPHREEPGHRSPMPVWAKYLAVLATIGTLLTIKPRLGGFMTVFPMVGVVPAYEARHSLFTVCRQMPVLMLSILPMQIVIRLASPHVGLGLALPLGWLAFLAVLTPLTVVHWRQSPAAGMAEGR